MRRDPVTNSSDSGFQSKAIVPLLRPGSWVTLPTHSSPAQVSYTKPKTRWQFSSGCSNHEDRKKLEGLEGPGKGCSTILPNRYPPDQLRMGAVPSQIPALSLGPQGPRTCRCTQQVGPRKVRLPRRELSGVARTDPGLVACPATSAPTSNSYLPLNKDWKLSDTLPLWAANPRITVSLRQRFHIGTHLTHGKAALLPCAQRIP